MDVGLAIKGLWGLRSIFRNEKDDSLAASDFIIEGNIYPLLFKGIEMKKSYRSRHRIWIHGYCV